MTIDRTATDWMTSASCRHRPELPWLADADDTAPLDARAMRLVCVGCPVFAECRGFVAGEGIDGGFWAGAHRDLPAQLTFLPGSGDAA